MARDGKGSIQVGYQLGHGAHTDGGGQNPCFPYADRQDYDPQSGSIILSSAFGCLYEVGRSRADYQAIDGLHELALRGALVGLLGLHHLM